jgi:hypothetical protein
VNVSLALRALDEFLYLREFGSVSLVCLAKQEKQAPNAFEFPAGRATTTSILKWESLQLPLPFVFPWTRSQLGCLGTFEGGDRDTFFLSFFFGGFLSIVPSATDTQTGSALEFPKDKKDRIGIGRTGYHNIRHSER